MQFLLFNFSDFLEHLAYLVANESNFELLYLEFPLIGTPEFYLTLTQDYPFSGKEVFFILSNSSLLIPVNDSGSLLKHIRQTQVYKRFLRGKLSYATLNFKKMENFSAFLFKKIYDKVQNSRRYLHIPNIDNYKKLAKLILDGCDEISADLPEENPFISTETLQILTGKKVTLLKGEEANLLQIKGEDENKTITVINTHDPLIKLDSISLEDVQKTLQSFFITPNVNREILEFLGYRSMGSYSKLIWLLNSLSSKDFFRWDEGSGWVIDEDSKFPYEGYYSKKSRKFIESMSKDERLLTYMIFSTSQPMDKADLLKLFPKVKPQTVDKILENLASKRVIKLWKNKIHNNHPVIEFSEAISLPEKEVRNIHSYYAHLLHTKRMSGFPIALWEIARHFELAGDLKNAFKYYYEAINEEMGKEQFDRAYQHAKKANLLAKTKKQKLMLNETIINLFVQTGDYHKALRFIESLKTTEDIEGNTYRQLIKREIELLTELGETNDALKLLEDHFTKQKRTLKEIYLLKFKLDYNADKLEYNPKQILKGPAPKDFNHNGMAKILEAFGDWEFYKNHINKAIEYYLKALRASKKRDNSVLIESKLAEMLFLNFKFRGALKHFENVLWLTNETKNKSIKETLLERIGNMYVLILPTLSAENFIRYSIDEILYTNPKTNYPFHFLLGVILMKAGNLKEGFTFAKQEVEREKQRGNFFKANLMSLIIVFHLLRGNQIELARDLLCEVKTKSEYIFTLKKLLEGLLGLLQDNVKVIVHEELKEIAKMNALTTLIYYELTERLKNKEVEEFRNLLFKRYNDLKNALAEADLWNYYLN